MLIGVFYLLRFVPTMLFLKCASQNKYRKCIGNIGAYKLK